MTTIIIVRHGNTFAAGEPSRRIGSRTDLPLTQDGREQASALGRWFKARRIQIGTAIAAPLQRTMETARLILAEQPTLIPLDPCDMLTEIDHGADENRTEEAVLARIGADALRRWDDEGIAPDGWIVDRSDRVDWWRDLFERSREGATLVVTSNGAAKFALLALPRVVRPSTMKLRTGACGQLEGDGHLVRCVAWDERPPVGA